MDLNLFIEKFAKAVEVEDFSSLEPNTEFRSLEEWSSLSVMFLIAFYDEEFNKEIGDSDIRNCTTIKDLYDLATA